MSTNKINVTGRSIQSLIAHLAFVARELELVNDGEPDPLADALFERGAELGRSIGLDDDALAAVDKVAMEAAVEVMIRLGDTIGAPAGSA